MDFEFLPIILSFKLATITSVLLLLIGVLIAYLLTSSKSKFKFLFEGVLSLPLVLPPSVLGFYLLLLLAPDSAIGKIVDSLFGLR